MTPRTWPNGSEPPSAGAPTGSASGSSAGSTPGAASAEGGGYRCPPALYADLLRSAGGDQQLVARRLAEMGFDPVVPSLPQPQSIKAVGGNGGGGGGGGGSPWDSLSSAIAAKEATKGAPAPPAVPPRGDADLDGQAADAGAPRHFFCPISLQLMRDPVVVAATGQTYDRPCIERWLAGGASSCPATGQALRPPVSLVPNVALRAAIEEWAEKHAPWLLDGDRRVKPLPTGEQFAAAPPPAAQAQRAPDPDLAFAIRMQQEELTRLAAARGGAPPPTPLAAGVAALGVESAAPPYGAPSAARRGGAPPPDGGARPRRGGARCAGWLSGCGLLLLAATAAYLALYITSLGLNGWALEDLAVNPWAGASLAALMDVGAQEATAVAAGGQWWRLFSSPFVNAGVIQLLLNMSCLWTFGRYLEGALRPVAAPALAATYLLGGWAGALASANLNQYYISCGASAGVCALLGAVCADQLVSRRRYVRHLVTAVVLTLAAAMFLTASLLPLLDPWCQGAALAAGFLCGCAAALLPRVRARPRRHRPALVAVVHCALLLGGGLAAAAVGVALDARLGASAFFKASCCQGFGSWLCVPSSGSPSGCFVQAQQDGGRTLYCPSGASYALPNGTSIPPGDTSLVTQVCAQYCTTDSGGDSGSAAGGGSGGGSGDSGSSSGDTGGGSGDAGGDTGGALPSPSPSPTATPTPVGGSPSSEGIAI